MSEKTRSNYANYLVLARVLLCFGREGALDLFAEARLVPRWFVRFLNLLLAPRRRTRGESLRRALTSLGGSFVKFGQALSVRPDIVGVETAGALASLQDRLPPENGKLVRAEIERAFGQKISALYKDFQDEASAAASVAQVHRATTIEGRDVAVKVLRPRIEEVFEREAALFQFLIEKIERRRPALKVLRLDTLLQTYRGWTETELDLRQEAASASQLAENMKNDKGFRVPQIDWQRTRRRVLTLEWIEGMRIDNKKALQKYKINSEALLERSATIFFKQTFRDGFFHADIHPGNLIVEKDGTLVPVDFGIMGTLDLPTRHHLADILSGFLQRDYRRVAAAYIAAGYTKAKVDLEELAHACRSVGEPLFGTQSLEDVSFAELLLSIIRIGDRFKLDTQTKLLLLHKAMLQAEGVGQTLQSRVNIWLRTKPLLEKWIRDNRNPRVAAMRWLQGGALGSLVKELGGDWQRQDNWQSLSERIERLEKHTESLALDKPSARARPRGRLSVVSLVLMGIALGALLASVLSADPLAFVEGMLERIGLAL